MNGIAKPRHVGVIGAGIVGICTALYLQRDGHRVTVIDRGAPGEGTSKGNAAIIAAAACEPVAMPGILWRVPGMLMDPLGPLAIRWSYLPKLAPWLLKFVAASAPSRVENASLALWALSQQSVPAFKTLMREAGLLEMLREDGWLSVYRSDKSFAGAQHELELSRRRGVKMEILGQHELRQMEPSLAPDFKHGVLYPEHAHTVNNFRLVQELAQHFVSRGGRILQEEVRGFEMGPQGPTHIVTAAGKHAVDAVVLAAGAWSKRLTQMLGHKVPLDTERGYHVMLPDPAVMPRRPIHIGDYGFVATPLEHGLRFAGTVELGGLDLPPNYHRARVLLERGRTVFPGLREEGKTEWMGFRPSVPDSVPVISGGDHANCFFAYGHGHLGLTYGAITGRLIADLVAGRATGFDMAPYRVDRRW
jgi:glycine/D-amino acid oxidase-like deaminating enzyme